MQGVAKNDADLAMELLRKQLEVLAADPAANEKERRAEIRATVALMTKLIPTTTVFKAAEAVIRDHAAKTDAPVAGPKMVKDDAPELAEPPLAADPR